MEIELQQEIRAELRLILKSLERQIGAPAHSAFRDLYDVSLLAGAESLEASRAGVRRLAARRAERQTGAPVRLSSGWLRLLVTRAA